MASKTTEMTQPSVRGGIVDALNQEWRRLDCGSRKTVESWARRYLVFAGCGTVGAILKAVQKQSDAGLHALLAEVVKGDELAGRIVLQSMIGRLVMMAQRDTKSGVDDYVAAMWCQVRTYPLAGRPTKIAANLALDTLKAVKREHRWMVNGEVTVWPPGDSLDELYEIYGAIVGSGDSAELRAESVLMAAHQLNVIDSSVVSLLTSVYIEGLTGVEAAARHQSSAASVRVRCSRAVGRLARAAPELMLVA